jgi:K+-transporting ATPase ATPase B chain
MFQQALLEAVRGLDPRAATRRPLLLGVLLGAALATVLAAMKPNVFAVATAAFVWLVLVVISLGAATVDVQSRALIERLRSDRGIKAKRIKIKTDDGRFEELTRDAKTEDVPVQQLRRGDFVKVGAHDTVPVDGDVVAGIATIKSPLSGRSAPLVRESHGERRSLVAGAMVLSDWLIFDVWSNPGEDFRERLLALGERARRSIAHEPRGLGVLALGLVLVGLSAMAVLKPGHALVAGDPAPLLMVLALLVCSLPATYAGLQAAIDVAGFDRLLRINVVAGTAEVVRAIGEVSVLLLDKASVRREGNCEAVEFVPMPGVEAEELAAAAFFASLADDSVEGRSIVALAEKKFGLVPGEIEKAQFHGYSDLTHLAGADMAKNRQIRKGELGPILKWVRDVSSIDAPLELQATVQSIASGGGTSLVVADGPRVLGVVRMTCPVRERLIQLRAAGMMAIVSTADNARDAAGVAAQAGADWFLPEATPEAKLALIRRYQAQGRKVAMVGDGNHDGPAMAQADVSIALNAGSRAAREAGGLIDLDADPTKLVAVVEVGMEVRELRRTLSAWCLSSDLAVGLALVPLVITGKGGAPSMVNPLALADSKSAVLAGLVVHALVLASVVPLALRKPKFLRGPAVAAPLAALSTLAAIKLFDLLVYHALLAP